MAGRLQSGAPETDLGPFQPRRLIGQQQAWTQIARLYPGGHGPAGVIFYGPDGVGKRTAAMVLAKILLSGQALTPDVAEVFAPDDRADSIGPSDASDSSGHADRGANVTRVIEQAAHPDMLYLDKHADKTEFTIDVVRRIGPFFAKTGAFSERRIVIIDGAERLNREASNALLKRLEEPPRGGMFILVSRSLGSLLPTVLSRCAKVSFAALSTEAFGQWCDFAGQPELATLGAAAGYAPGQALGLSDGKVLGWLEQLAALEQAASAGGTGQRDRLAASLAGAIGKTGDQSFRNPFLRTLRARQPGPNNTRNGQDQRLYRDALAAFARIDAIKVNPEDEWRELLRRY